MNIKFNKKIFSKSLDLIVLREIVTSISGIESASDLTQEHLDSLCGGDILRSEVIKNFFF